MLSDRDVRLDTLVGDRDLAAPALAVVQCE